MKLVIGNKIENRKNVYILEAEGYFGDMDEHFYWRTEYPPNQLEDGNTALLNDFIMLNKLKDRSLETHWDMEQWLEEQNIKVDHIPIDSCSEEYLPRIDKLFCVYYNNIRQAFEVNLK